MQALLGCTSPQLAPRIYPPGLTGEGWESGPGVRTRVLRFLHSSQADEGLPLYTMTWMHLRQGRRRRG